LAQTNRHDPPDELVSGLATTVDEIVVGLDLKTWFESRLSRRNCQTFSTELSSGHFGGSGMMVMLAGTIRRINMCQSGWSTKKMAWAAGATGAAGSESRFSVLQVGRIRAAPLPILRPDRSEDVGGSSPLVTSPDGASRVRLSPGTRETFFKILDRARGLHDGAAVPLVEVNTQSRMIWRPTPPIIAASVRVAPS
jgi:hypothetical protein